MKMMRKIMMMCAAALFVCAGALAADDGGSDPVVLSPGEWTTGLTVNGKRVWSKYSAPKGGGWNCTYDSKAKCFKLNLIAPLREYTLGGELTGRVMDNSGKVTDVKAGTVSIDQTSTVTLDNFSVTGMKDDAAVAIKDGKLVTIVLKGKNEITPGEGGCAIPLSIPRKATLTITGGETDSLNVHGRCEDKIQSHKIAVDPGVEYSHFTGGCLIVNGGQSHIDSLSLDKVTVNGGSLSGGTILHAYYDVEEIVVAGGFLDYTNVSANRVEISGSAKVSYMKTVNLTLEDGADLTVTKGVLRSGVDCDNFYMKGGKVNDSSASGISFERLDMQGGSIACQVLQGKEATLTGGEMRVVRFDGAKDRGSLAMNGGLVTTDSSSWNCFEQKGGRFIVNEGGSYKAKDFYLYGGTFLCGTAEQKATFDVFEAFVTGGSLFVGTTTDPDFRCVDAGGRCYRVTVNKLPPNERVAMDGLGSYGKKDLYADGSGTVYLYFSEQAAAYQFSINGNSYQATVHGADTNAKRVGAVYYKVVYKSNSGFLKSNREWTPQIEVECEYGDSLTVESPENLSLIIPDGKRFSHWRIDSSSNRVSPGDVLGPISGYVYLSAIFEEDIVAGEDDGFDVVFVYQKKGVSGPVAKTIRQRLGEKFVFPTDYDKRIDRKSLVGWFASAVANVRQITVDTIADGSVKRVYARYLDRTDRTTRPGNDAFANAQIIGDAQGLIEDLPLDRATKESGEFFYSNSAIAGTLWYRWTAPMDGNVTFSAVNRGTGGRPILCGFVGQMSVPFVGFDKLQSSVTFKCTAGTEIHICVASDGASSDVDLGWNVVSEAESTLQTWTMNRYGCAELMDLGIEVPTAAMKAVKAEGLPKGLKLVQDKEKVYWYIEGVATEPLDYVNKFATIRFQSKVKGVDDNVQKLALKVVADKHAEHETPLGDFSMSASGMFGVAVEKSWTVSGTPSGLKYDKNNPGFTGKLSKLGAFTLVAKESVKSAVPGTSTKFNNVYTAELLVKPVGGYDDTFTVYKGETMKDVDITSAFDWTANTKSKSAGRPSGMKYASGVFSGKVTGKVGMYPVTVTSADKQAQAVYLVRVADPAAPEVGAYFGTKKIALMKKMIAGDAAATKNGQYTYMMGSTVALPLTVTEGSTVKATGLPSGLKLAQDKTTKVWSIGGYATKTGTFLATVTATLNGVSTAVTYLFEIVENAFAGEYRGVIASSPAADAAPRAGTIIVNIAEGGATKVTVCEDGKSTLTYSAKSFGYVDSGDYAFVEFELKPSSADAKLGYGVRKGRVTITKPDVEADDYRILQGTVKLEDGTAVGEVEGNFVAPSAANALDSGIDRESRFFTVSDGGFDVPIATVRHEIKSGQKIPTADIAVTLYDGTTAKIAKQPIVRDVAKPGADEAQRACYSLAPFAVKAKDGQVFVFHGFKYRGYNLVDALEGVVTFVSADGELVTVDETDADEHSIAAMELNDYFKHMYKAKTTLMTLDYGWNGFETFALDHVNGGTKRDCLVFDLDGAEIAKIPAKNKVGMDGAFSYKFTTKDKVTYQLDLVVAQEVVYYADGTHFVMEFVRLVGMVTKSWKDGKETKTLHGIVDFMTLDPEE